MEEFISDWFIPMDFGNDMPDTCMSIQYSEEPQP